MVALVLGVELQDVQPADKASDPIHKQDIAKGEQICQGRKAGIDEEEYDEEVRGIRRLDFMEPAFGFTLWVVESGLPVSTLDLYGEEDQCGDAED